MLIKKMTINGVRVQSGYVPKSEGINSFFDKFTPNGNIENERNGR